MQTSELVQDAYFPGFEEVDAVAQQGYGAIVFGQFTMSLVAPAARERTALPILTTPDCAVRKLRRILEGEAAR